MEVIGVLHRHPTASNGLEGEVSPTANLAAVFRDCAGTVVKDADIRSFSATGGTADSPRLAKHELGHAAFELGDEYTESDATRRVTPPPLNPVDASCCCDATNGGIVFGTAGGGVSLPTAAPTATGGLVVQCIAAGGGLGPRPGIVAGAPACNSPDFPPPQCGASRQAECPGLAGDCVSDRMWLGTPLTAAEARTNAFGSEGECEDRRAAAVSHPGVEDEAEGLGTCRQLCGPAPSEPCPCGVAESWIVDTNPAAASPEQDTMGRIGAAREGGTCGLCVETSLCVRWQRARGDSPAVAWGICEAPPADAVERERQLRGLLPSLLAWLEELLRGILF